MIQLQSAAYMPETQADMHPSHEGRGQDALLAFVHQICIKVALFSGCACKLARPAEDELAEGETLQRCAPSMHSGSDLQL